MNEPLDIKSVRNNLVAKDNRLIQNSRYALSNNENKAILYLISKIKPDDPPGKRYLFSCREFQALIKWNSGASYQNIKKMLTKISDMRCWIDLDDNSEALVRWFNIVHMNKGTGEIEISFHEDMFPFLLDLQKRTGEGHYFTSYKLQNISLMKHRYSPRVYEILKSYQFNNRKWTFENGTGSKYDLQRMIGDAVDKKDPKAKPGIPATWSNWAVFKRDVLDPAVNDINKYTDIKVAYDGKKEDLHKNKTRAVRTIEFYMVGKTIPEQKATDDIIDAEYSDAAADAPHQYTIEEMFFSEHEKSLKAESEEKKIFEAVQQEKRTAMSKYPMLAEIINDTGEGGRNAGFDEAKIEHLFDVATNDRVPGVVSRDTWELFAVDLITYYYDKIIATNEDTKTSVYKRLVDCLRNDYDGEAYKLLARYAKRTKG